MQCFDYPLKDIKNRILKTHGIYDLIFYATQRYEKGNQSLYLINGFNDEDYTYDEWEVRIAKGILVPNTEDFDRERDKIHFLGCKQLCVTTIRPNTDKVHMIYDINFPTRYYYHSISIKEKRYTQAVVNMERVYRLMDEMQFPDPKLYVLTIDKKSGLKFKPTYQFDHDEMDL